MDGTTASVSEGWHDHKPGQFLIAQVPLAVLNLFEFDCGYPYQYFDFPVFGF